MSLEDKRSNSVVLRSYQAEGEVRPDMRQMVVCSKKVNAGSYAYGWKPFPEETDSVLKGSRSGIFFALKPRLFELSVFPF